MKLPRNRRVTTRVAATAAALSIGLLSPFASAAQAYEPEQKPSLWIGVQAAEVTVGSDGKSIRVFVANAGPGAAPNTVLALDFSGTAATFDIALPDDADGCTMTAAVATCSVGTVEMLDRAYVTFVAKPKAGVKPGSAGSVKVTASSDVEDAYPENDTLTFALRVVDSGPDLVAYGTDLNTAEDPVEPADRLPLSVMVANEGDVTVAGIQFVLDLPQSAAFEESYEECNYSGYVFDRDADFGQTGAIYGPSTVMCWLQIALEPGEALFLFDPDTGDAAFHARFGTNTPGPEKQNVTFSADVGAWTTRTKTQGGLTAKVQALRGKRSAPAASVASTDELVRGDNQVDLKVFTAPNTVDMVVSTTPVKGDVGSIVEVPFTWWNNGPSDGTGPDFVITAPTGTEIVYDRQVDRISCVKAEEIHPDRVPGKVLYCNTQMDPIAPLPDIRPSRSVRLKIVSETVRDDGTILVDGSGTGRDGRRQPSKESKPANNTAKILVNQPEGGADGGTGGSLPITGARAGIAGTVGAVVLAAGIVMFVVARRRRVVLVVPDDEKSDA